MFRRRRQVEGPRGSRSDDPIRRARLIVREAEALLLLSIPTGRPPRLSLAEALAGFEAGLAEAAAALGPTAGSGGEEAGHACKVALEEAARRAEHLRLEGTPEGYEQLAPRLQDLLEPLAAFIDAEGLDEEGAG
jgi:hypothetical protein